MPPGGGLKESETVAGSPEPAGRSARALFTNWSSFDGPLRTKLRLTARNRWRAVVLLKGCCGHPGEPGC